jgi:hypothetical protein
MFQSNAGEKVIGIRTRMIHPDDAPTSAVGTAPTTTTGCQSSERDGKGDRREVRLRAIEHTDKKTLVPHVHRYTDTPKRLSTPTSGVPTSRS